MKYRSSDETTSHKPVHCHQTTHQMLIQPSLSFRLTLRLCNQSFLTRRHCPMRFARKQIVTNLATHSGTVQDEATQDSVCFSLYTIVRCLHPEPRTCTVKRRLCTGPETNTWITQLTCLSHAISMFVRCLFHWIIDIHPELFRVGRTLKSVPREIVLDRYR